jgi:hypothetical protein
VLHSDELLSEKIIKSFRCDASFGVVDLECEGVKNIKCLCTNHIKFQNSKCYTIKIIKELEII